MAVPAPWVEQDIYFLHHILELCDYFLPYHSNSTQVMDLFSVFYSPRVTNSEFFKRIVVCRFFSLIGICPDDAEKYDQFFFSLISAPIDIMLNMQDDIYMRQEIDRWLLGCIKTHPHADRLQTMHFFNYNG